MAKLTSIGVLMVIISVLETCKTDTITTVSQSSAGETDAMKYVPEKNENSAQTSSNSDMFQTGSSFFEFPQVIPPQQLGSVEEVQRSNRQQPNIQQYGPYDPTSNILTSVFLNNQQSSNGNILDNFPQTIQQFNNQQVSNGNGLSNVQQSIQQLNNQWLKTNSPVFGQVPSFGIQDPARQIDIVLGCPLAQQPILYNFITKYPDSNGYKAQTISPLIDTQNIQSSVLDALNMNSLSQRQPTQQQQTTNLQNIINPQRVQNIPSSYYPEYLYPSTYFACQYPHCQVPCGHFYNSPLLPSCCLPYCTYPPYYENYINVPPYNNNNYYNNPSYNNNNLFNSNKNNPFISLNNNQKTSSSSESTIIVDNSTNIDKVKVADNSIKGNTVNAGNQSKTSKTQVTNTRNEDNDEYLNSLFVPVWIGPEKKYRYLTGPKDYSR